MNFKIAALAAISVAATSALMVPRASADAGIERVEISSPIFPRVLTLYAQEGANFPTTLADEQTLAHNASLTFETLLTTCEATDHTITLFTGTPLTPEQLETNYRQVAQCSYDQYTVKPYWIPQLVNDVGICEAELGADWHLLSEADLASFTATDYQFIADTLTGSAGDGGSSFFGTFYFSSKVFVRAADNSIQQGDLAPGVASRVTPLVVASADALKNHYEGGLALRCIRRTALP